MPSSLPSTRRQTGASEGRPEPGRGTVKKRGGRGPRFSERPPTQENKRIWTSSWFDSFQALTGLHGSFRPGAEAHQPEALPALPRLRSSWVSEAPPCLRATERQNPWQLAQTPSSSGSSHSAVLASQPTWASDARPILAADMHSRCSVLDSA